jgi:site-specific DNA-methyltransferase (adenine-specific)
VHELHHGNCLDILRTMPDNSIDAVVTDPPYGLSFMGKRWDYDVPSTEIWAECLRVLKPGGYLLAFAGTRTQHRMAVRIEDAGFEIRDMLAWMYGSGFPKSHNLDGEHQGWGTALKPAMEPITMARKPFKATVAQNVQEWGTGAINIDGCRIPCDDGFEKAWDKPVSTNISAKGGTFISEGIQHQVDLSEYKPSGRWPANVLHDGSAEILQGMGEAARFFYTPKACKDDRDDGCDNNHPTVKPTDLMRYLCRMVTPTGGIVLDPFTGSGSTGRGAVLEGFRFIGCEMDADYIDIAKARILAAEKAYQPCLIFD